MNELKAILRRIRADLLERRLWPVAVLLVAALVAVPLVLRHKPQASAAVTPAAPVSTGGQADPVQAVARALGAGSGREPSGPRRDPFPGRAAGVPATSAATPPAAKRHSPSPSPSSSPTSSPTHTSSSSSSSSHVAAPVVTAPTAPDPLPPVTVPEPPVIPDRTKPQQPESWTIYSADIRFGADDKAPVRTDVNRLAPLPGAKHPAVLFAGIQPHGRGAVFVLTIGAKTDGGGRCVPGRHACTQLVLQPGQHAVITTADARTFRIEVAGIHARRTTSRAEAEKAYARASRKGICLMDELFAYRFDPETGTVARNQTGVRCTYTTQDPKKATP